MISLLWLERGRGRERREIERGDEHKDYEIYIA
jgi:hypothetical protein